VRALYVLREKEEEHEMSRTGDSDSTTDLFRGLLDTECYPFADSSVPLVGEVGRLLEPLLEVRLRDSMPQHEAPDRYSGI
jgi:hypothetical protein